MEAELRRLLDELRTAIDHTQTTPEARAELSGLADAIDARLTEPDADHAHLSDAVGEAARRFEAEHPSLGQTLRSLVHGLGASGI